MDKTSTHIGRLREQVKENRQLILAYTGMSPEAYGQYYSETAEVFLKSERAEGLMESKIFWAWWTRRMDKVDAAWLNSVSYSIELEGFVYSANMGGFARCCTSSERVLRMNYLSWHKESLEAHKTIIKHSFNSLLKAL